MPGCPPAGDVANCNSPCKPAADWYGQIDPAGGSAQLENKIFQAGFEQGFERPVARGNDGDVASILTLDPACHLVCNRPRRIPNYECDTGRISAMGTGQRGSVAVAGRRRRPAQLAAAVAAYLAAAFGATAMPATACATTIPVGRCGDIAGKGGYTLRVAVNHAVDGDTVDLSYLPSTCSTITLLGGEISVPVNNLTVQAPLDRMVTVDGANAGRVFEHTGSGLLDLFGLNLQNGNGYGNVGSGADGFGGCVRSAGSLLIQYTSLSACSANIGGGAHSAGNMSLIHATISGSSVHYKVGLDSLGGAAASDGILLASYSTISGNYSQIYTGGVYAKGAITINRSTISGNSANFSTGVKGAAPAVSAFPRCTAVAGAADTTLISATVDSNTAAHAAPGGGTRIAAVCTIATLSVESSTLSGNSGYAVSIFPNPAFLTNSTISGNGGAIFLQANATLLNSTLAFNGTGIYGLSVGFPSICILKSVSTIAVDIADSNAEFNLQGTCSQLNSSNNLTGVSAAGAGLTPLAYRGGPTKTHGLMPGSPAIDAGTNPGSQSNDQRGPGFPRFVGSSPDIGAFERQLNDDELFYSGME